MAVYLGAFAILLILAHIVFIFAVLKKRNDFADVMWGPGFAIAAFGGLYGKHLADPTTSLGAREGVVLLLVTVWAVRLFIHVGVRDLKSPTEDIRYQNMRKPWGANWILRTYISVFLLQSILLFVIDLGVLRAIQQGPRTLDAGAYLGLVVWLIGFIFESVGDRQLKQFKADTRHQGQLMTRGLWSWSRHPNYFGEVVQWWGLFLICLDSQSAWIVLSPLTISFLILKVSGVPMLEKLMQSRPGFAEYAKKTSIFFPWPPRKSLRVQKP